MKKRGFTLLEVNLAIMVMAGGILSMCGLYSLGFRENRQSVEDVAGVAFADAYLAPLVQGLSATNMVWSDWVQLGGEEGLLPASGWAAYVRNVAVTVGQNPGPHEEYSYRVQSGPNGRADGVAKAILGKVKAPYKGIPATIGNDYSYGLVLTRTGAKIQLAFRASRRQADLMMQPIIVQEIYFQGKFE